ncbi:helix-turn-helix domain-containing protein [Amycolatopsis sp. NPDC059021]|uniref:helix-turn-helix domain-containing protein n=1 Tax=Amycolatopsis sp. NPDC059021 TaxID=3346704 RepID=UPI00366BD978
MNTLDLLLHPVRNRIVQAMSGDRVRTTTQLCARLPDVPKTSVYRHVGLLAKAGILEVVDEQRVHGAVERYYRLRRENAKIDLDLAKTMTLEDHRRAFTGAMAALLAEFGNYLDREDADPPADLVGYRQGIVWLTDEEHAEMVEELVALFRSRWENSPAPGRRPRLVSAIFFPAESPDGL